MNIFIDDSILFTPHTSSSPVCLYCDRYDGYGVKKCRAFPDGIPDDIWTGKNKHQLPYPNDRGFQFKLSPETNPEVAKSLDWILPRNR